MPIYFEYVDVNEDFLYREELLADGEEGSVFSSFENQEFKSNYGIGELGSKSFF